ncbi:TTAGGG repeat binding factor [Emydomyces testavorans]|uniref:TTAGGG repeat binding factor n=1 Tax=Emydomyces testavorans TaxID=2070801 RepID=A0AAF0DP44_9EURO|nr:TTAGGG repeat binding factor [Emydomyces testavorans]
MDEAQEINPALNVKEEHSPTVDSSTLFKTKSTIKATHPRDSNEPDSLCPAAKKRRTDFVSEPTLPNEEQLVQNAAVQPLPSSESAEPKDHSNAHNGYLLTAATDKDAVALNVSTTQDSPNANVLETISTIVHQPGRIENQPSLNRQLQEATKAANLSAVKSNSDWKTQSLPILDNLATQILSLLARSSYQDTTSLVSEPNSENGHAYATMRSLFDHTKNVYSTNGPFLSTTKLGFVDPVQVDIIRKANMASFVSSIFGTQHIGFSELHDHFLDIFVPDGSRLLKVQGALFLELKTQAFIASLNSKERSRSEILHTLFPDDLGLRFLARKPGNKQLAPSETDFVKRAWSRRDILLAEIDNPESVSTLPEKYRWEDFLRDLSSYISKHFNSITNQCKKASKGSSSAAGSEAASQAPLQPHPDARNMPLVTQFPVAPNPPEPPVERSAKRVDLVARAARAAQIALQGQGLRHSPRPESNPNPQSSQRPRQQRSQPPPLPPVQHQLGTSQSAHTNPALSPPPPQQPTQITFHQTQFHIQQYDPQAASAATRASAAAAANYGYMPGIPHYSQSQPTQVLYERARMATTAKSSPTSRRTGLPSQRRPWTTEEENALMAGLDRVKGPHWSQILAMFGPGGTINEALKDRNQVQLKDKARNLKLFFLKSGIEVPYYLKFVTGDLRTRAPAQAAKQEARERERRRGEEDKAHVEGLEGMMALAGAHPSQNPGENPPTNMAAPTAFHQPQEQHPVTFDATTEQALIQRLTQENKSESSQLPPRQSPVDPSLQV